MNSTIGIIGGLAAAFFASVSYIMSRRFTSREGHTPHQLMALAHVFMAVFSIILLPFIYIPPTSSWSDVVIPLICAVATYFGGQFMLFALLRRFTASNIAPMLGLKLAVAAVISIGLGQTLSVMQCSALLLAVGAVLLLRNSKEGLTAYAIGWVLAICICYSISDFSISYLTVAIDSEKSMNAVLMSVAFSYISGGIYPLLFFNEVRRSSKRAWKDAFGYAVSWYVCMFFLFAAYAYVGVVHGVILQSMRSIISVVIGVILARMGYSFLEEKVSFAMRQRQFIAAILMVAAICLYSLVK